MQSDPRNELVISQSRSLEASLRDAEPPSPAVGNITRSHPRPPTLLTTAMTSSVDPAPGQTLTPETPVELRKRSVTSFHLDLPDKSKDVLTSIEEKQTPLYETDQSSFAKEAPPTHTLTVWQRFFCKPVDPDPEKAYDADNRVFSFWTIGSIVGTFLFFLVISAIIGLVLTMPAYRKHHHQGQVNQGSGNHPLGYNSTGTTIRQAIPTNFADPFILQSDGVWYAYSTSPAIGVLGQNQSTPTTKRPEIQVATSTDFANWTILNITSDPLPTPGAWTLLGYGPQGLAPRAAIWAPALFRRPSDSKWVLWYAAMSTLKPGKHCVGAAVSTTNSPLGPFEAQQKVFACPVANGGAIDPSPFVDSDDSLYVAYKIDGNSMGHGGECGNTVAPLHSTPIMLQKLEADGMTANGTAVQILDRTDEDGPLVEAPSLVKSPDGLYFLFFSSGCTRNTDYTVKYAWSQNVTGPYTRAASPLLKTGDFDLMSPGSCTVTQAEDKSWKIAFHARVYTSAGGVREMFTSGIQFNGTVVSLVDPLASS